MFLIYPVRATYAAHLIHLDLFILNITRIAQKYLTITQIRALVANTRVYPNVSGLAAWSENCKWYSSAPQGAVVSLFCESAQ